VVLCASSDTVRKIMLKAAELHFDNGEYVFINIDLFSTFVYLSPTYEYIVAKKLEYLKLCNT